MATANSTTVSTNISVAGNICYGTLVNRAAGFTSYPTTIMLTGTMGYNTSGTTVTYNLDGRDAYIEITGSIPGTTTYTIYQSYVFIYDSTGLSPGSIVPAVDASNNSPNTVISILPTVINNTTVSFQLSQSITAAPLPIFVVQITAFSRIEIV